MGIYKAEFLWNDKPDSIEALGYEFANAKTEEYRKQVWNELVKRIKSEGKEIPDEKSNCIKPAVMCSLPTDEFLSKHRYKTDALLKFGITEMIHKKGLSRTELIGVLEYINNLR